MPRLTRRATLGAMALALSAPARGAEPVTLLIPFAAGGATDRLGRLAKQIGELKAKGP